MTNPREEFFINRCIADIIPQSDFESAVEYGKEKGGARYVNEALKPFKKIAISKIEAYLKKLKEELNG